MSGRVRWLAGPSGAHSDGLPPAAMVRIARLAVSSEARPDPLPPTEADAREAKRRPAAERAGFLSRRAALRRFVGAELGRPAAGVEIAADAAGAPVLLAPPSGWFVSSAARDGWVAMALASSPVGVDIEVLGMPAEPAWNVLSASERVALAHCPEPERWSAFLTLWTAKEAYLKARRVGLALEPRDLTVLPGPPPSFALRDESGPVSLAVAETRSLTIENTPVVAACVVLNS